MVSSPGHAYVLSADYLVHLLAEGRKDHAPRDVTLVLNDDLDGHDHPLDARLYLKRPERSRLVEPDETTHVIVDREGQTADGDDKSVKFNGGSSNLIPLLLMPKGKDADEMHSRIMASLHAVGIETPIVTFGHLNDTIAYIIGAQGWETEKAQVWLEKGSLFPIRFIIPTKVGDKTVVVETRLLQYGAGPAGPSFPRIIEMYENGKLIRHAEVTAAQFNQDLPDTLFDLGVSHRH